MVATKKIIFILYACFIACLVNAQVVNVNTATQLQNALNSASPGETIVIADGYYERSGGFYAVAGIDGTAANPITVVGSRNVVLSTNNLLSGYAFSLKGNKYWIIKGFTVTKSKNGVVIDSSKYITIDSIQAKHLGQDGVHLRTYSSYCTVKNCDIDSTGLNDYSYGEGIYIGSAYSNWCTYTDCNPDTCNYNQVLNNRFGDFVTAENVDVKEGTKGGLIKGNTFNGTGLQGMNGGDSWIDMKGNYFTVEDNIGNNSILDGFQTHIQQPGGFGNYNIFRNNALNVNATGYGIRVQTSNANGTALNNVVCSSNTISGAGLGLTNVSIVNCTSLFPSILLDWKVSEKGSEIDFNWVVSSVDKINKFVIQQSKDGADFSILATIPVGDKVYHYSMPSGRAAGRYFRLIVYVGSTEILSQVIKLNEKASSYHISIDNNQLVIRYPGDAGSMGLRDATGQFIKSGILHTGFNYFRIASPGRLYIVSIYDYDIRAVYSRVINAL